MKLIDLEPEWLSDDVFIFKSPTGKGNWLTCKRIIMESNEQEKLIYENNKFKNEIVVMTIPDFAWNFEGNDF